MTEPRVIRVGHSPDPDDAFMFHALANEKMVTPGLRYVHQLEDIETLNRRALQGELEVSAVSIHAYAHLLDKYALLSSGSSMGDGYGPLLVAKTPMTLGDLVGKKIAIPGTLTTAFLTLSLALERNFTHEVVEFDKIPEEVISGRQEVGLLIHEGQLTYKEQGLHSVCDLGVWWKEKTGLPLPLGGNVVRKDLGPTLMRQISTDIKKSIRYGLEHREEALVHALKYGRGMDPALADQFVGMYVNDWTLDYGDRGRVAIRRLLEEGHKIGLLPAPVQAEFVE
ncbi:MAG: ABC transporter substrate-binding protein [Gemmataceae bacterium]|nr:ABC transporter substrate-binding protein [Gemmataceae bacterium]